jgi:hypothetical protein
MLIGNGRRLAIGLLAIEAMRFIERNGDVRSNAYSYDSLGVIL